MHKKKKFTERAHIAERNAENGERKAADFPQERLVILLYHLIFKSASAEERCGGICSSRRDAPCDPEGIRRAVFEPRVLSLRRQETEVGKTHPRSKSHGHIKRHPTSGVRRARYGGICSSRRDAPCDLTEIRRAVFEPRVLSLRRQETEVGKTHPRSKSHGAHKKAPPHRGCTERDMAESALRGAMRRAISGGSEEQCSNRGCCPCVGRKQR